VGGLWAVLHRVGSDRAGPLDSVRTRPDGSYAFTYSLTGVESAIYFVSASYGGIAYFTPPLRAERVTGDDAEITVFDTTTKPVRLRVRGRHLVVSASGVDGSRAIVEVVELSNDTTVTLVAGSRDRPTWATPIPPSAHDFKAGQGDVPAQAIAFRNGRAEVYAPFPPGVKQVAFAYAVPSASFPLRVPLGSETAVLEVLVEDSLGTANGARLAAVPTVEMQGRHFRRFLAQDAPANGVVTVDIPRISRNSRAPFIAAVITLSGIVIAATLVALGRGRSVAPAALLRQDRPADVERLAREIAGLDDAFESNPTDAEYREKRDALKHELVSALAARDRHG
jgi:hypothetical protein